MKEKSKKILKGLGVGALACVGMFGLTGCANIEVSQDKVDSMIETVEKVDVSLDEYKELLEKANRMTKDEVWNLAMTADFNLMMNVGGVRDNLVITGINEDLGLQQDIALYYNNDNFKVAAELEGDGNGITGAELWYQISESNVVLANIEKAGTGYMCDFIDERSEDDIFENCIGVYRGGCPGISMFNFTFEDLNHYEILENGNVKLTFVKYQTYENNEEEYYTTLKTCTLEYSLDKKLTSLDYSSRCIKATEGAEVIDTNEEMKMVLTYGAVNTELVESWVEIAEAKRNEQ